MARIPAIAQGTSGSGSYSNFNPADVKERIRVLSSGIDLGMAYLDTAELYGGGFAEEVVGKVIKGRRGKVFVASKFNPKGDIFGSVVNSLEGSLRRMKTDYIDLYQLHWPNPLLPISEVMNALAFLVEQGKIRYIGVSNFSLAEFKEAQSSLPGQAIVSNQVEYNLLDRSVESDFLPFCSNSGVTLIAYSALNQGRFLLEPEQQELLDGIAFKYGKTIPQIVLRWLISHDPVIAITRSRNMAHTDENARSTEFDLEPDDIQRIDKAYRHPVAEVSTSRIRLKAAEDDPVYGTMEEALENRLDFIPSPLVLSKIVLKRKCMKPIRLVPTKVASGRYDFDIDPYDIRDNVKKYWAWIIAYGDEAKIPAVVMDSSGTAVK